MNQAVFTAHGLTKTYTSGEVEVRDQQERSGDADVPERRQWPEPRHRRLRQGEGEAVEGVAGEDDPPAQP